MISDTAAHVADVASKLVAEFEEASGNRQAPDWPGRCRRYDGILRRAIPLLLSARPANAEELEFLARMAGFAAAYWEDRNPAKAAVYTDVAAGFRKDINGGQE